MPETIFEHRVMHNRQLTAAWVRARLDLTIPELMFGALWVSPIVAD
ncbi:hypothetical protein [Litorivivens sp.]